LPSSSKKGSLAGSLRTKQALEPKAPPKAPKPRKKKKQESDVSTFREIFANLSPWGYTKLIAALMLVAAAATWGVCKWGYYSGQHLQVP